jgi:hypothetical protein
MHVVQTAAEPPNHGRISFEASGWTRNNRQALDRIVVPKRTGSGITTPKEADSLLDWVCAAKLDN